MGEKIAFENGGISDFQGLVTFTLNRVILHTAMHQSSTSTCIPNRRNFLWTDGRTDGHLRPTLLGWLGGVDLKRKSRTAFIHHHQWQLLNVWSSNAVQDYILTHAVCPIRRPPHPSLLRRSALPSWFLPDQRRDNIGRRRADRPPTPPDTDHRWRPHSRRRCHPSSASSTAAKHTHTHRQMWQDGAKLIELRRFHVPCDTK